jgi:hypothetical protein
MRFFLDQYFAAAFAMARPTSTVPACPPISRVRGPSSASSNLITVRIASAAGFSPRCFSVIAPDLNPI